MADTIYQFRGIDPISRQPYEAGENEPDQDPRGGRGTEVVRGLHLMSAVDQLEPADTTSMAYLDPEHADRSLEEIERLVREEGFSLEDVMTTTDRFTPLVNPRRSRHKNAGEMPADSDADLWHVPTSHYSPKPPSRVFAPLARAIDENDSLDAEGVSGEFRTRRNGGEVFGEVWFDDFRVDGTDSDPVRLGFKTGWNYFGSRALFVEPYAQQTSCKNSVAPVDDKQTIMAHNTSVDYREMWEELLRTLGLYGDRLSQQIAQAGEILFAFERPTLDEDDTADEAIPVPFGVERFYELAGIPGDRVAADHALERASTVDGESASVLSAWSLHSGATYWLSWHWDGSEDSRAFREYRRTANDMLFNPQQVVERVRDEYETDTRREVIEEVGGQGSRWEDLDDQQRNEVNDRLTDHDGVATIDAGVDDLGTRVEEFEETESRLKALEEAIQG